MSLWYSYLAYARLYLQMMKANDSNDYVGQFTHDTSSHVMSGIMYRIAIVIYYLLHVGCFLIVWGQQPTDFM